MGDWYNVVIDDIDRNGGIGLLNHYYNGSPSHALQRIYPEHHWDCEQFKFKPLLLKNSHDSQRKLFFKSELETTPIGFWKEKQNHRQFFDWLMSKIGYQSMDDWYKVTQKVIITSGGEGILRGYYNSSPSSALQTVYPNHKWELEKFKHRPQRFWKEQENHQKFFNWLQVELDYTTMDDWYNVTRKAIVMYGGEGLLSNYYNNSPSTALMTIYPEHKWDRDRFRLKLKKPTPIHLELTKS